MVALFERVTRNWPAKVLSLAAAFLLFFFTNLGKLEERYITVPLEIRIDSAMAPASPIPATVRVFVRGETETVSSLREEEVMAFVDFSEIKSPGYRRHAVQLEMKGAAKSLTSVELRVDPIDIPVELEYRLRRSVDIRPTFLDQPAYGYELEQVVLTPSSADIEGPESSVVQLTSVRTESVSLAGRRDDFEVRVRLERPGENIRFSGGDTVDVRGTIRERIEQESFDEVEVFVDGLADNLVLDNIPGTRAEIRAAMLVLEHVKRSLDTGVPVDEYFRLSVDASGIDRAGEYQLPVQIEASDDVVVEGIEPQIIVVRVLEDEGTR